MGTLSRFAKMKKERIYTLFETLSINEKESDMAYDAVLISTFANAEALARYKVHPEHVKVSNYCKKIRESRAFVDFTE